MSRRERVRFDDVALIDAPQPDAPAVIGLRQADVGQRVRQFAGPDHIGGVNIRAVVDVLFPRGVARCITHQHKMVATQLAQFAQDAGAAAERI